MQQTVSTTSGVEKLQQLRDLAEQKSLKIEVRRDPLKRIFDCIFSLLFLLLASPLFLAITLLVLCTSPGPVFYRSRRFGRGGKIIECLKFRSMYKCADEKLGHLLASDAGFRSEWMTFRKFKKDPRVTPLGIFLRKTSLDELPQFWNVLKGDLSVVGPRPQATIDHSEQFEISTLYGNRASNILSVRPGITGVWQISGRNFLSLDERSKLEEEYAMTRTFWQDLRIIAKTIPAVLASRGAC